MRLRRGGSQSCVTAAVRLACSRGGRGASTHCCRRPSLQGSAVTHIYRAAANASFVCVSIANLIIHATLEGVVPAQSPARGASAAEPGEVGEALPSACGRRAGANRDCGDVPSHTHQLAVFILFTAAETELVF